MNSFRLQNESPLVTEVRVEAGVRATADATRALLPEKACGNTYVLNQVASGAIAKAVFSQFKDLCIVCKISEGRKDRHPRLDENEVLTQPMSNPQVAWAIVDPVECEGQYALTGPKTRASMVLLALAPEGTLPQVDSSLHVCYLCLPPGAPVGPNGIEWDTDPERVLELLSAAYGRRRREEFIVTVLQRPWTKGIIDKWQKAGATVECITAGDFQAIAEAGFPVQDGQPVRLAVGVGGLTEIFATVPLHKQTGATILMQVIPRGREMNLDRIKGSIFEKDSMITSEDCVTFVGGLSEADARLDRISGARYLVPGPRQCSETQKTWVTVLVASPVLERLRYYVVEYQAAGSAMVTLLEEGETFEEYLVRRYLSAGNTIETRFDETTGREYFQQWDGCFVPGLRSLTERQFIDLLQAMRDSGLIEDFSTPLDWDTMQYRVTWSVR